MIFKTNKIKKGLTKIMANSDGQLLTTAIQVGMIDGVIIV